MPNFLTNATATFKSKVNNVWVDQFILDVARCSPSASQQSWAKFSGTFYSYKILAVLSEEQRNQITEEWRITVGGKEFSIEEIKHSIDHLGYDHTSILIKDLRN